MLSGNCTASFLHMVCNVRQFLPTDDDAVPDVEELIHSRDRVALPVRPRLSRRRRFRPQDPVKLDIWGAGQPEMVLTGHSNSRGDIYIALRQSHHLLRKLHTHEGHFNPGGELVSGTHMHFPSRLRPLLDDGPSYAYQLEIEIASVVEGVMYFCDLLNIWTDGIQSFLGDYR